MSEYPRNSVALKSRRASLIYSTPTPSSRTMSTPNVPSAVATAGSPGDVAHDSSPVISALFPRLIAEGGPVETCGVRGHVTLVDQLNDMKAEYARLDASFHELQLEKRTQDYLTEIQTLELRKQEEASAQAVCDYTVLRSRYQTQKQRNAGLKNTINDLVHTREAALQDAVTLRQKLAISERERARLALILANAEGLLDAVKIYGERLLGAIDEALPSVERRNWPANPVIDLTQMPTSDFDKDESFMNVSFEGIVIDQAEGADEQAEAAAEEETTEEEET